MIRHSQNIKAKEQAKPDLVISEPKEIAQPLMMRIGHVSAMLAKRVEALGKPGGK